MFFSRLNPVPAQRSLVLFGVVLGLVVGKPALLLAQSQSWFISPVEITATPAPPWNPGQTVTFTVVLDSFQVTPPGTGVENFLSGLALYPSRCWENVRANGTPATVSSQAGQWRFGDYNFPLPLGRQTGFFFDDQNTPAPLNPTDNRGDGDPTAQPLGPWTFSWRADVPNTISPPCELCFDIRPLVDWQTAPTVNTLSGGPVEQTYRYNNCQSINSALLVTTPPPCPGGDLTIDYFGTLPANNDVIIRPGPDASVGPTLNGPGPHTFNYFPAGRKEIVIEIYDLDAAPNLPPPPRLVQTDTLEVEVPSANTQFDLGVNNLGADSICPNQSVLLIPDADSIPGVDYEWRFTTPGDVFDSITVNPINRILEVQWAAGSGLRTVQRRATAPGCNFETFSRQIYIKPLADDSLFIREPGPAEDGAICAYDSITVQYGGVDTPNVRFFFDQAIVDGADTGRGGKTLTWPLPGQKTIRMITSLEGCLDTVEASMLVRPVPVADAGPQFLDYCQDAPAPNLLGTYNSTGCTLLWSSPDIPSWNRNIRNPVLPVDDLLQSTRFVFSVICDGCTSATDTITVRLRDKPEVNYVGPNPNRICVGGGGDRLNITASGGTGELNYSWSPPRGLSNPFTAQPVANPSATTLYSVIATDEFGCQSDTSSVLVQVDALPDVTAISPSTSQDTFVCGSGTNVQLEVGVQDTANQGFVYSWTPSNSLSCSDCPNPVASPTTTTIYRVTVCGDTSVNTPNNLLNNACCSSPTDSNTTIRVKAVPIPIADAGPDSVIICDGDTTRLIGTARNGNRPFLYTWTPNTELYDPTSGLPDNTLRELDATPNSTTNYSFQVSTPEGCVSEADTIEVLVREKPQVVLTRPEIFLCFGDTTQALTPTDIAYSDTGPNPQYIWSPGTGISDSTSPYPRFFPNFDQQYLVQVNNRGCLSDPAAYDVFMEDDAPQFRFAGEGPNGFFYCCNSGGLTLDMTLLNQNPVVPFSLQWSPDSTIVGPSTTEDITVNPCITTTYYVEYRGICQVTDSVQVIVGPSQGVSTEDTLRVCQGDAIQLTAFGAGQSTSFRWTPEQSLDDASAQNPIARPLDTTAYVVRSLDGGCSDSDTVTVLVVPQPEAEFSISQDEGCLGMEVAFRDLSRNAGAWQWDFGDGAFSNESNPLHRYSEPGLYEVILTVLSEEGQCRDSTLVPQRITVRDSLVANAVIAPALPETLVIPETEVFFQDFTPEASRWLWLYGDGNYDTLSSVNYRYETPGLYEPRLVVYDPSGCVDTLELGELLIEEPVLDEIPNVLTPNGDGRNDRWVVDYNGSESFYVKVYDRWGAVLYESSNPGIGWNGLKDSDGSEAANGIYFYAVEIGDKIYKGHLTLMR